MEVMMSHLHAGPAVAARSADAAEVAFLVCVRRIGRRGSVYDFSTFAFPYRPVDIDTAPGALFPAGACGAGVSVGSQCVYRRPRSRYTWQ